MGNDFFKFKQFTIFQHKSAMKVCTDACLLGAFAANDLKRRQPLNNPAPLRVLDIGAGTGLLSLMLAQKIYADIDAVELDPDAAEQAKENAAQSPWGERIKVHNVSVQDFDALNPYDVIISNPPFFNQSLQSSNKQKTAAKHTTTLSFSELADNINKSLAANGTAYIMLPYNEMMLFEREIEKVGFFAQKKVNVRQTAAHPYFRSINVFVREQNVLPDPAEIIIKTDQQQYSAAFTELLKDYYLYL